MLQNIVLMFLKSYLLLNKAINMSVKWLEKNWFVIMWLYGHPVSTQVQMHEQS